MYFTNSKNISLAQPVPKLSFHESDLAFHLVLYMINTIVQTQGKRLECQESLQYIPSFSFNTVFINLMDVKFHSFFSLKTKTESDKENYTLFSQVLAEALEILACLVKSKLALAFRSSKAP